MRTMRYYIVNKNTNQAIFTDYRRSECEKKLNDMETKEDFEIRHKWMSI